MLEHLFFIFVIDERPGQMAGALRLDWGISPVGTVDLTKCLTNGRHVDKIIRMTVTEAAAELGVSVDLVRKLIQQGRLSAVKHGPIWWIEPEALDAVRSRPKPGRPKRKESEGKSI